MLHKLNFEFTSQTWSAAHASSRLFSGREAGPERAAEIEPIFIWECRKTKMLPNFRLYQKKIEIKRETERFIAYKNKMASTVCLTQRQELSLLLMTKKKLRIFTGGPCAPASPMSPFSPDSPCKMTHRTSILSPAARQLCDNSNNNYFITFFKQIFTKVMKKGTGTGKSFSD